MQMIEGDTLEKRLATGAKDGTSRGGYNRHADRRGIVGCTHARGMVHRDIKPANVLLEKSTQRVKLTDFGLARASDDVKLTRTGMVAARRCTCHLNRPWARRLMSVPTCFRLEQ